MALYRLSPDNTLSVEFPKEHGFSTLQDVTLHLDNRTGVSEYDADLRVFRVSYKGVVRSAAEKRIEIEPREFMLYYFV